MLSSIGTISVSKSYPGIIRNTELSISLKTDIHFVTEIGQRGEAVNFKIQRNNIFHRQK